ncbi:uncharacterized protein LOC144865757 [Branchiostoma floridae x Branchiostoma japonicum]
MVKMATAGKASTGRPVVNDAVSVENDTPQLDYAEAETLNPGVYLYIASAILNNASAILGIPVVLRKLNSARREFAVDLSVWKEACLLAIYKMTTFSIEQVTSGEVQMKALDGILEDKTVHEWVKSLTEDGLRNMIFDPPGIRVATRLRQLKKFQTLGGRMVISLSCARFNKALGRMLAVWAGVETPLPFILKKSELDFDWSERGEKLSNAEFDQMINLIERLLQGIPDSTMQPLPVSESSKKNIRDRLLSLQNQEDENTEDSDSSLGLADEGSGNFSFLEMQGALEMNPVSLGEQQEDMEPGGRQMITWFREAEHAGFLPEEVQAALHHCGNANPVDWLKENWRELVARVAALATEGGKKLNVNIVGVITTQEAADALRKKEGDFQKSIKECIDCRRKKFVQMMQDSDFEQDQVLAALQENGGDTEKAILAIQLEQLRPFQEHSWQADENPQHVELKDGGFERNVRMLLCQFNLPSWERAVLAVKLIASGQYESKDIIEAVTLCDGLVSCRTYLLRKPSYCPRFPWCDTPLLSTTLSIFFRHVGDPQFASQRIYRRVMCMLLHALRDCTNKSGCPVRRAIAKAYADYVIADGRNGRQAMPFDDYCRFLVRNSDHAEPSPWLVTAVLERLHRCVKSLLGPNLDAFSLPQLLADEENISEHQAEMLLKITQFTPYGYTEALEAVLVRGAGETAELSEVLNRLTCARDD